LRTIRQKFKVSTGHFDVKKIHFTFHRHSLTHSLLLDDFDYPGFKPPPQASKLLKKNKVITGLKLFAIGPLIAPERLVTVFPKFINAGEI